jgi:hypothetical protein
MSVKTEDRLGKLGGKAGMCMKTRHLDLQSGNVDENKGG